MSEQRLLKPWETSQGFGDVIEQARIIPYVAPHCPGTTLVVRSELVRLFSQLGLPVIAFADVDPEAISCTAMAMGPANFVPRGIRIPRGDDMVLPPLWADETVQFTSDRSLLQVGLCWQGSGGGRSAIGTDDDFRCISPGILQPLLRIPGVQFTALHFVDHAQALPELPNLSVLGVWDFAGTAAVMKRLDLVITIDTSVAHLAGSLCVPTWLMLVSRRHNGFDGGRWNCTPPSYSSVRQFRQETPGDWGPVIAEVEAGLRSKALGRSEHAQGS